MVIGTGVSLWRHLAQCHVDSQTHAERRIIYSYLPRLSHAAWRPQSKGATMSPGVSNAFGASQQPCQWVRYHDHHHCLQAAAVHLQRSLASSSSRRGPMSNEDGMVFSPDILLLHLSPYTQQPLLAAPLSLLNLYSCKEGAHPLISLTQLQISTMSPKRGRCYVRSACCSGTGSCNLCRSRGALCAG